MLRAGRDLQRGRAVADGRHLQIGAQRGLGDVDRQVHPRGRCPGGVKNVCGLIAQLNIQVARRRAVRPGVALAGQADLRVLVHARGDAHHADACWRARGPRPAQRLARALMILPSPPQRSQGIRLTNCPKIDCCMRRTSPRAAADDAGGRRAAGGRAHAAAVLAYFQVRDLQILVDAEDGLLKFQAEPVGQVRTPAGRRRAPSRAAEFTKVSKMSAKGEAPNGL